MLQYCIYYCSKKKYRRVRQISSAEKWDSLDLIEKTTFEQRLEDDEEIIQGFSGRTVHWAKGRDKDMLAEAVCVWCVGGELGRLVWEDHLGMGVEWCWWGQIMRISLSP